MSKAKDWKRTAKNLERARRADKLLRVYERSRVERKYDYTLSDMICDILHLAGRRGEDPDLIASRAIDTHFAVERKGGSE